VKEKTEKVKETADQVKNSYEAKGAEGVEEKAKEHLGNRTVEDGKEAAKDLQKDAQSFKNDLEDNVKEASEKVKQSLD
jgi:gas vesicle protein